MLGTKKNKSAKQAAISSHPAFPAVVALWFAALLGLGSLVLPVALFEKFVTATGISSVISAAQPPLGATARIAIAVFAAIGGAVAGLLIARKVAAAQVPATLGRSVFGKAEVADDADLITKKPISALEELGSESLDEPIAEPTPSDRTYSGKRRSLAVTDDSGPSDYFDQAPLPGGAAMVDQFVEEDSSTDDEEMQNMEEVEPVQPFDAPLELAEIATEDPVEDAGSPIFRVDPVATAAESPATSAARPFDAPGNAPFTNTIPQASVDPVADLRSELGAMTDQSDSPSDNTAYNPLGGQSPAAEPENNPFAAPVVKADAPNPIEADPSPAPEPIFEAPAASSEPQFTPEITDKSLSDLGVVELVERFALALQAKADAKAQKLAEEQAAADAAPLVFQRSGATPVAPFEPSEAEDAGDALAQFFAPAPQATPVQEPQIAAGPAPEPVREPVQAAAIPAEPVVPSFMQPVGFDDSDDGTDDTPSLSLSLNTAHQPFSQTGAPVEEEAEDESAEYSSLLAMKSPFASGQEFVRIEDEPEEPGAAVQPTVVFPGSERRATPAVDGPSRDPFPEANPEIAPALRPFDAPGKATPTGLAKPASGSNSADAESALRDALEKLQRMSGAA